MSETRKRPGWEFGDEIAADEGWASLEFDHLQSGLMRDILDGPNGYTPEQRQVEAQRIRDARPYLIADPEEQVVQWVTAALWERGWRLIKRPPITPAATEEPTP